MCNEMAINGAHNSRLNASVVTERHQPVADIISLDVYTIRNQTYFFFQFKKSFSNSNFFSIVLNVLKTNMICHFLSLFSRITSSCG